MFQFKNDVLILCLCWCMVMVVEGVTSSVVYQAINASCVNSSYLLSNSTPYQLAVPPLSYVDIQIDLRHLQSLSDLSGVLCYLNIVNVDTSTSSSLVLNLDISTNAYRLYAASNIILSAGFKITDSSVQITRSRSYMIAQSMSAYIIPAMPTTQVQQSFYFVITKQDLISLPYNTIPSASLASFEGYFITRVTDKTQMVSREQSINSYSDYWNGIDHIATPYLPYFSNCQNNGDFLHFSQMIHNASDCQLYGYDSIPINQLKFGSSATADSCKITRNCMFDEIPNVSSEYPFWNNLDASSKYLFSITANEYTAPYAPIPNPDFTSSQLVSCLLSASGDNTTSQFPMKVTIDIGYYQQNETTRKIMTCKVTYSLYAASTANFTYQLELVFSPLNNTQILLAFGFDWYVYILVFIIIGVISNVQFLIFWIYHVITSAKKKINTRILVCLKMLKQIFKGAFFAIFIIIVLIFMVQVIMNGTFFGTAIASMNGSFWNNFIVNNIGYFASTNIQNIQMARFGVSYIVVAIYLAYQLSHQLVGQQRSNQQNDSYEILGRKFKPSEWNRGKLIFGSLLIAFSSIGYLYFTYSSFFNANIWFLIVSMQVGQMILQQVLYSLYDNILACLHLKISIGVLAYLATMGAIDLYYFVLGYLVDVAISTIEIAYLTQIQQRLTAFVEEKNEELHRFYLNLLNEDDEEELEKKSLGDNSLLNNNEHIMLDIILHEVELLEEELVEEYNEVDLSEFEPRREEGHLKKLFVQEMVEKNKQELEQQKKLNLGSFEQKKDSHKEKEEERLQRQTQKFDLLVDCATNMMQYILQPIVVLMLWITYNSSAIMSNFQIAPQNCILYFLSTIILAVCYQINIIIIINVLEVYFNYDYKKLIEKLLDRFQMKKTFWITDEEYNKTEVEGLETKLRGCYKYCLSSQMFFVVSLFCFSMYLFVIGFTTIIASHSNIFKDPFIIFIVAYWLLNLHLFKWILMKIVYFLDIWGYKTLSQQKQKTENQDDLYADQQTEQIMLHQSAAVSSNIFTYKLLTQESQYKAESLRKKKKIVFQSKLKTICKSLEPTFQKEDFRLQYAIKNKDFIRKNIEKILPLIECFPQNDSEWLGRTSSEHVSKLKKQAKNVDPMISDFITGWLKRVEANRSRRQENGIERQRRLKKCNFCFKTWALYYGYDGLCLDCSRELFESKNKPKKE